MEQRSIKILFSNDHLSVSKWSFLESWSGLSLLNLFRKWSYQNIKTRRVLGFRINDYTLLTENHNQVQETTLEIISLLKEIHLPLESSNDRKVVTVELEGPLKVKLKKIFPKIDLSLSSEILLNILPGEKVKLEFLTGQNWENQDDKELIHEGKSFMTVSKDLVGVSRCYFEEMLYSKNSFKMILETTVKQEHNILINNFFVYLKEISGGIDFQDYSPDTVKLEELGLSERTLAYLHMKNIVSKEDLLKEKPNLDWGQISLDSATILRSWFLLEEKK